MNRCRQSPKLATDDNSAIFASISAFVPILPFANLPPGTHAGRKFSRIRRLDNQLSKIADSPNGRWVSTHKSDSGTCFRSSIAERPFCIFSRHCPSPRLSGDPVDLMSSSWSLDRTVKLKTEDRLVQVAQVDCRITVAVVAGFVQRN